MTRQWASLFGKPDGTLVRLRCRLLGHRFWQCDDDCCGGRWWCARCFAPRETEGEACPKTLRPCEHPDHCLQDSNGCYLTVSR